MDDAAIAQARADFAEGQKKCGTSDVVARVRRMPDGSIDVAWLRREAMRSRLRLGSLGGTQPHLARIAAELARPAPKGSFYAIAITKSDDSDATLVTVARSTAAGTPVANRSTQGVDR